MVIGRRSLLVYVLLALTAVPTPIYAQVAGATLAGTVTDPSGAVVPNAKVSITNTATGVARDITTDEAGFYSAPNLLPGIYDITAVAPGFSTYVQKGFTLTVGASLALNISVQVGQVSQQVDVSASAPAVQLSSSTISAEVNSTTVRELPLNGRDWTQLAALQPGVVSIRVEAGPTDRGNRGFGTQLTIAGHQPYQINYRVNGITINDYSNGSPGSVLGVNLGVDAIQEFSVLTSNYSAEYGRTSGGVINAITKTGTNDFHGDVYYFLRDKVLNARNYFDVTIPPFHRHQFGVSAGGPIRKDKTFIFGDYEGILQDQSHTFEDTVPSGAARAGHLCSAPDGTCSPTTITVSPLVTPFLPFYPEPNAGLVGNGDTGFFKGSGVARLNENYATVRGDHKISDKDSLAASWFYDRAPLTQPDALLDVIHELFTSRQMGSIEETHVFSLTLVNTIRGGYSRVQGLIDQPVSATNPLAADPSLAAIPGRFAPSLSVPGLTQMNGALGSPSFNAQTWNSFQFYDDAFLTRGTHSLKFGFAAERMQYDDLSAAGRNGTFSFPSLAGFLLDQPSSVILPDPAATKVVGSRQTLFGLYLQDDWRWRPNLTVNLGLRYEPVTLPTEAHGGFGVLKSLYSISETIPVEHPWSRNQTLRNFEPKVGFSWDPFRNGKTAVRGGFGVFDMAPLPWVFTDESASALPFARTVGASNLPGGSFPKGALSFIGFDPTKVINRWIEQNPRRNYVMNWNFNVQREIASNLTAMLAYVGSHTLHQPFTTDDSNMVLPQLTSAGYLWPFPVGSGTVLNPHVGAIRATRWDNSATYESFEAQLTKRMSHGIQAQGAYTWGKCIDMGSGSLLGDPYGNSLSSLMFFNRQSRHGLCDFNITHNFVLNYIWQLSAPKFGGPASYLLRGWQLGGIFTASTGTPFTVVMAGDPLGQNSTDPWPFPDRLWGQPGCANPVNPGNVNNYL